MIAEGIRVGRGPSVQCHIFNMCVIATIASSKSDEDASQE